MRAGRVVSTVVGVVVGVAMLGACGGGAEPATGTPVSAVSSAVPAPSKLQVTVPGLGGATTSTPSVPETSTVDSPPGELPPSEASGSAAPSSEPEDGVASGSSEVPAPASDPAAVEVQLVGCDGCEVLGTHANVVGDYSAALIGQGGRAAVISVDPAGALVAVQAVPYGVTFTTQPGGRLACGAGGRCLVSATQPDGRAVLSAFGLGADGKWTDLSGSDGFVSATGKAVVVTLEDALGAAVQVTDGTTTIWNVLAWNGSVFATIGCGPDGDAPDLATLDLAACLS